MPKLRVSILIAITACVGEVPLEEGGVDDTRSSIDPAFGSRLTAGASARVANTGGAGLRLRASASASAAILKVMPEGATVDVLEGPSGPWYRVRHAGTTGWSHGDFLRSAQSGGINNLLPWSAYTAFYVSQGHNGGSHVGAGAWAWDFATPIGTPILAAHVGTVRLARGDSTFGGCSSAYANDANYVIVDQGNGYESLYLHLSSVAVASGQAVSRGDLVGYSGQTGWSCGPHLHFQIQLSPGGGGGGGFYNQSIHDYFYDHGAAWDPAYGTTAESRNGVADVALTRGPAAPTPIGDPHGGAGDAWDLEMRAAADQR
jgi:murein DD-endopeptidase MepM/ murein hydrolase activator NlpD